MKIILPKSQKMPRKMKKAAKKFIMECFKTIAIINIK